jgi:hypothetical protein
MLGTDRAMATAKQAIIAFPNDIRVSVLIHTPYDIPGVFPIRVFCDDERILDYQFMVTTSEHDSFDPFLQVLVQGLETLMAFLAALDSQMA